MKSSNVVVLSGNLTGDPESFSAGCNLRLAVNMREKDGDDWKDRASFFDVVVFGKQADACMEHLAKGRAVIVEGQLRQDRWTNDSGDNRSKVKVVARNVVFVGGKPEGNGGDPGQADLSTEPEPEAQREATPEPAAGGSDVKPGTVPDTPENLRALCICKPGLMSDKCPIVKHGIPF